MFAPCREVETATCVWGSFGSGSWQVSSPLLGPRLSVGLGGQEGAGPGGPLAGWAAGGSWGGPAEVPGLCGCTAWHTHVPGPGLQESGRVPTPAAYSPGAHFKNTFRPEQLPPGLDVTLGATDARSPAVHSGSVWV